MKRKVINNNGRNKAFIGAAIGAVGNIVGGIIGKRKQKKAQEKVQDLITKYNKIVDEKLSDKEKELMSI